MTTLIVYDSMFGNTEKIAKAIFDVLSKKGKTSIKTINSVSSNDLKSINLLVVGTPTNGGRPTVSVQGFLDSIPEGSLKNVKFAVFDTRFSEEDSGFMLKKIIKFFGYPAPKISDLLVSKGGKEALYPEGFIVTKKEGPLKEGEIERAKAWVKSV